MLPLISLRIAPKRAVFDVPAKDTERLLRMKMLTFSEAVNGHLAGDRLFSSAIQWSDGDTTFAAGPRNYSDTITIVLNERNRLLEVELDGTRYKYAIEWEDIESVLDALNKFYTTRTSFWTERVWPDGVSADAEMQARTLLRMHRETNPSADALRSASVYQGTGFQCIRMSQGTTPKGECLGKELREWNKYADGIKSLMIEIPFDMHVASVAEDKVDSNVQTRVLPNFVSTTMNFHAVDDGAFDKFADGNDMPTVLALTLKEGVRVLPLFALESESYQWEYEVLLDAGQRVTVLGEFFTEKPKKRVVSLKVERV